MTSSWRSLWSHKSSLTLCPPNTGFCDCQPQSYKLFPLQVKTSFARQDITDAQWGLSGASWITSTLNIASGTEAEVDALSTLTPSISLQRDTREELPGVLVLKVSPPQKTFPLKTSCSYVSWVPANIQKAVTRAQTSRN